MCLFIQKLGDPSKVMQFQVEERLQCSQSKTVRYTYRNENAFPLPIPLGDALNFKQYLESEERINKWKAEKDLYEAHYVSVLCCLLYVEAEEVMPSTQCGCCKRCKFAFTSCCSSPDCTSSMPCSC